MTTRKPSPNGTYFHVFKLARQLNFSDGNVPVSDSQVTGKRQALSKKPERSAREGCGSPLLADRRKDQEAL